MLFPTKIFSIIIKMFISRDEYMAIFQKSLPLPPRHLTITVQGHAAGGLEMAA